MSTGQCGHQQARGSLKPGDSTGELRVPKGHKWHLIWGLSTPSLEGEDFGHIPKGHSTFTYMFGGVGRKFFFRY